MANSIDDLLSLLRQRGIDLWIENDQLRFRAPKRVILPEDLEKLRASKNEIVRTLQKQKTSSFPSIAPRPTDCLAPLTTMQYRWWRYFRENKLQSWRMCTTGARILGPLDIDLLQESIHFLAGRHEILRTRFIEVRGAPVHHVAPTPECTLEVMDLSELPTAEGETKIQAIKFVETKVDLSSGPLCGIKLFKLSHQMHVLVVALDHMICDGLSNEIFDEELWTLYAQATEQRPFALPPLYVQFGDYAEWQQRTCSAWQKEHAPYWINRLSGSKSLRLPLDDIAATETRNPARAKLEFFFGNTLSSKLRDLARHERMPVSLVVLGLFAIVIANWCDQRELIISIASNGRYRRELDRMIGFLATTLYLRLSMDPEECLPDWLRNIYSEFQSASDHHDFDRVPDLFPDLKTDIGFNWLSTRQGRHALTKQWEIGGGLKVQPYSFMAARPSRFNSFFGDSSVGIIGMVEYDPGLFRSRTVERFRENLLVCAEKFSERPNARLRSVSLARNH